MLREQRKENAIELGKVEIGNMLWSSYLLTQLGFVLFSIFMHIFSYMLTKVTFSIIQKSVLSKYRISKQVLFWNELKKGVSECQL